jgi:hypothetical protein
VSIFAGVNGYLDPRRSTSGRFEAGLLPLQARQARRHPDAIRTEKDLISDRPMPKLKAAFGSLRQDLRLIAKAAEGRELEWPASRTSATASPR